MTTIERAIATTATNEAPPAERAVFVTHDDRRSRRLHQVIAIAGGLALLWLAGLAIGMLGVGGLPKVSLPIPGVGGKERPAERAREPARRSQPIVGERAASDGAARDGRRASIAGGATEGRTARRSRRSTSAALPSARRGRTGRLPADPGAVAQPPVQPTPVNVAPPPPQPAAPGLARRGLTLPPGQARRAADPQPQPPIETPGQTQRREKAAATTTTTTETPPPGKDKPDKQQPPPPPKG